MKMKHSLVCTGLLVVALFTSAGATAQAGPPTLAEEVLALELGTDKDTETQKTLKRVIGAAAAKFGTATADETETEKALRFFRTVDQALIEQNFVFPPRGLITFLKSALKPRSLSEGDYQIAKALTANKRRATQMDKNRKSGGVFHFADCDLSAILVAAVGQKLGLPIAFVEVPKHNFVRWSSPTLKMNWDTNDGRSYSDAEYTKRWSVTEIGKQRLGWLTDMPRKRIITYWLGMIGGGHERQKKYTEAEAAFRLSLTTSPDDLGAANELAWFLATCKDANSRNGEEAEALAKQVVDKAPRANWIDTLAAAQAEQGDFDHAVETELKAKEAAKSTEWGISAADVIADFDKSIAAYRMKLSYREAVEKGLIEDPTPNFPYD